MNNSNIEFVILDIKIHHLFFCFLSCSLLFRLTHFEVLHLTDKMSNGMISLL